MNINTIRKQLPSGAIKEIAQKTGLSTTTVSHVFRGKARSPKQAAILNAAAEFVKEYKAKEAESMRAITEALNPQPANAEHIN